MGEIPLTDSGERIILSVNEDDILNDSAAYTALSNLTNPLQGEGFRPIRDINE
jgi:hypothetical protein